MFFSSKMWKKSALLVYLAIYLKDLSNICKILHLRTYVCIYVCTYARIRHQWPATDIGGWPLVNESSRNNKKKQKRIAFKVWTAVPCVEKYKIGAAVQILEIIHFFLILRRFISVKYVTIHEWGSENVTFKPVRK